MDFKLAELLALMRGYRGPWWVCGGWAVDLALGRQTREHADLEIAVPRGYLPLLREYFGAAPCEVVGKTESGQSALRELGAAELPAAGEHELYFTLPTYGRLEVLLNDFDGALWSYRRDPRVTLPLARFGRVNPDGIPCVTPEVLLLYKAKGTRDKDEQDFAALLPLLDSRQLVWLADSIWLAHPRHPWLDKLKEALAGTPGSAVHRKEARLGFVILLIAAIIWFLAFGLVAPGPK